MISTYVSQQLPQWVATSTGSSELDGHRPGPGNLRNSGGSQHKLIDLHHPTIRNISVLCQDFCPLTRKRADLARLCTTP